MTTEALPYASTQCVHHERIEEPHGPASKGVCLKCGREKEYATSYGY